MKRAFFRREERGISTRFENKNREEREENEMGVFLWASLEIFFDIIKGRGWKGFDLQAIFV